MSQAAPRVGLFGGSFDPVHDAHVALARRALADLALDRVLWLPAGQPWQKTRRITDAEHRVAMLRLAIAGEPRFVLDLRETQRTGPSYTLDSVRELQAELPQAHYVLIVGQDQAAGLPSWHGWQELLGRVQLAAAQRPGVALPLHPEVARAAPQAVMLPMMDISSTEVRRRVATGGDITALVCADVAGYIARHHLYQEPNGN